jgi:AcrR family transcriptional regulator
MAGLWTAPASAEAGDRSLFDRRWELYRSAAPVFERDGFRGATVDLLSRACFMSPAGLYHYFPSKAAFALFPLTTQGGLCQAWHRVQAGLPAEADPLFQVHAIVDFVATLEPEVRLAFRLNREMVSDGRYERAVAATVLAARADWLELARSIVPAVDEERAMDFFEGIVSIMATADVPGIDRKDRVRRHLTDLSRGWASSFGVTAADFEAAGHAYEEWAKSQEDSTRRANLANARRISAGGRSPERAQKRNIQPVIRPDARASRSVVISVPPSRSLKRVVHR